MTEFNITGQKGTKLYCIKDIPKDARCVAVIVHGFAEHCGRYGYIAGRLVEEGIGVYRFDNRGHGRSGGEQMDLEDYRDLVEDTHLVVQRAREENPGLPLFMVGHSMGGFITASYGITHPDILKGQVLSGAATGAPNKLGGLLRTAVSAGSHLLPRLRINVDLSSLLCRDPDVVQAYRNDPLISGKTTLRFYNQFMIEGIGNLQKNLSSYRYPCLVLHGENDEVISCKNSVNFVESISSEDKQLKIYEGMYHEIFNEYGKESVVDDVAGWIKDRI